jgi:hypothetical protein
MERKWPGKICRQGQFRRGAGPIEGFGPKILYNKINILISNSGMARRSHG